MDVNAEFTQFFLTGETIFDSVLFLATFYIYVEILLRELKPGDFPQWL